MSGVRGVCVGLLALVAFAPAARADLPPGPSPSVNRHLPVTADPPRRGVFRTCGSGMGVGLAGIGVAWGLMWVGTRCASRITRRDDGPKS